jgi:PEP-CTERM motif
MRRLLGLLVGGLFCAYSAVCQEAQAIPIPATLNITADGNPYSVPMVGSVEDGHMVWRVNGSETGWGTTQPGYSLSVSGEANEDPFITYGITVTDFGAPSAFSFFFTSPMVPIGTNNSVNASLSGALNDASGNGVSITPTQADADGDTVIELQTSDVTAPATNMGVDVGTALAFGPGAPGAFYPFGPFAAGPQPGPGPGFWTGLQATVAFTLSGGSDTAVLTGRAEIVQVPEPASFALAALAAIGALAYRRR